MFRFIYYLKQQIWLLITLCCGLYLILQPFSVSNITAVVINTTLLITMTAICIITYIKNKKQREKMTLLFARLDKAAAEKVAQSRK